MGALGPAAFRPVRQRKVPRPAWKVANDFRHWIRKLPCACGGRNPECSGPRLSAHVDYAAKGTPDAKGMSSKVADRWCIPLTDPCHRTQHNIGWPAFERRFLPEKAAVLAEEFWSRWPGRRQWEEALDRRDG